MLQASHVAYSYGSSPVLGGVSLRVDAGEVLGLIGPNGSGKTTLLRTLYGSLTPNAGVVTLHGTDIRTMSARDIALQIAVVVQEPPGDISLDVADTVLLGRIPHLGVFERQKVSDNQIAMSALDRMGALHLASRAFSDLSGGERQRVLMARALTQQVNCLLLDEPTNHLDIGYQHQVLATVRELGMTSVVVLHDLNLAARYCDRLVLLDHGTVRSVGSPREVLSTAGIRDVYGVDAEETAASDGTHQLLFSRR